jgi:D-alanine-D-alanine ligase
MTVFLSNDKIHSMVIGIIFGGTGAEELANLRAVKDFEAVAKHYNLVTRRFYLNAADFNKCSFVGVDIFFVIDSNCKDKNKKKRIIRYIKENNIPFIGQSESTISLARDKKKFSILLQSNRIHVANSIILKNKKFTSLDFKKYHDFITKVGYPVVVKDNFGSSSENLALCKNAEEFFAKYDLIAKNCKQVLIEQYIGGSEITNPCIKMCGENISLNPIEIIYKGKMYDYRLKNITLRNKLRIPPHINRVGVAEAKKIALRCDAFIGSGFYSRTDMKVLSGNIFVLEINGEPVLSKNDFVSRSARSLGISYPKLIIGLLCNSKVFREYAYEKNVKLRSFIGRIEGAMNKMNEY